MFEAGDTKLKHPLIHHRILDTFPLSPYSSSFYSQLHNTKHCKSQSPKMQILDNKAVKLEVMPGKAQDDLAAQAQNQVNEAG